MRQPSSSWSASISASASGSPTASACARVSTRPDIGLERSSRQLTAMICPAVHSSNPKPVIVLIVWGAADRFV